jgi:isoleucyl-tRNA synthetase
MHYPFENKDKFEKNFPAEFIAEGVDQTRAWFYYLHVLATALKNSAAFKNVIVNGIVLAEDGKKMSKHLKNYTDPYDVLEKYSADAVRYYLTTSQVMKAEDLCFSEKEVDEVFKKVILILLNVLSFYKLYASDETKELILPLDNVLDIWIVTRLELMKKEMTDAYNEYDLPKANRPIAEFINDLSTWYVRRSRERFKEGDKKAVNTLRYVLMELSKLMAPVMPFLAEYLYKELKGEKESVHLEDWPKVNELLINKETIERMKKTREAVEIGLALRSEAQIKIRQPLKQIQFADEELFNQLYEELVKEELNVYEIALGPKNWIDTEISPELEEEGIFRELTRKINQLRKEEKLSIEDKDVVLEFNTDSEKVKNVIEKFKEEIKKKCLCEDIRWKENKEGKEFEVNGEKIILSLR